jgi:chromosome transmission fidelity protein 4
VSTTTIQGKRRNTPDLFGNDEDPKAKDDDADVHDDFGMMDDDWIIDDIGGGMLDNPPEMERAGKSRKDGFVKEMGRCIFCSL